MTTALDNGDLSPKKRAQELVEDSNITFMHLGRWYNARCDHPLIQDVVSDISKEIESLCGTLVKSRRIAGDTYELAEEMIDIFQGLSGTVQLGAEAQAATIKEAQEKLRTMKRALKNIHEQCGQHHQNIMACSEKLEGVIENVDNEQMALKKENDKAETRVTWVSRAVAVMVAGIFVATGPTSVVAGTLAGSAVGLGVPYIHLKKGEIKARTIEIVRCDKALEQLHIGCDGLQKLQVHIQRTAEWWDRIDTVFNNAMKRFERFSIDQNDGIDEKGIALLNRLDVNFGNIRDFFLEYKVALGTMQRYFPKEILQNLEHIANIQRSS